MSWEEMIIKLQEPRGNESLEDGLAHMFKAELIIL